MSEIQGAEVEKIPKLPSFLDDSQNEAVAAALSAVRKSKASTTTSDSPAGAAALRRGTASKKLSAHSLATDSATRDASPLVKPDTPIKPSLARPSFILQLLHDCYPNNIYAYGFIIGVSFSLVSSFVVSEGLENIIGTLISILLFFDLISSSLAISNVKRPYLVTTIYMTIFVILWGIVAFIQCPLLFSSLLFLASPFSPLPSPPVHSRKQEAKTYFSIFTSQKSQFDWTLFYSELHSLNYVIVIVSGVLVAIRVYFDLKAPQPSANKETKEKSN